MKIENFVCDNIDLGTVQLHITLSPLQESLKLAETLNGLVGNEVDLDAKKHREKRSLNANSYERVLEAKIADAIGSSKDEVHNEMLARYGEYQRDENGNIVFVLAPASVDYSKDPEIHLKPTGKCEDRKGVKYYWYAQMLPSHEMDSQQFARLIDGVVSECREMNIETLSDDEIKHMMASMEQENTA